MRQIRNALARAVERDGLRPTARAAGAYIEGGLAPTGLQKFLDGGVPYERTMAGYRMWLVHEAQARAVAVDEGVQRAAMTVLVRDLAPLARTRGRAAAVSERGEGGAGVAEIVPLTRYPGGRMREIVMFNAMQGEIHLNRTPDGEWLITAYLAPTRSVQHGAGLVLRGEWDLTEIARFLQNNSRDETWREWWGWQPYDAPSGRSSADHRDSDRAVEARNLVVLRTLRNLTPETSPPAAVVRFVTSDRRGGIVTYGNESSGRVVTERIPGVTDIAPRVIRGARIYAPPPARRLQLDVVVPEWIDADEASSAIAEYVSALNALHVAAGGEGLQVDGIEVRTESFVA